MRAASMAAFCLRRPDKAVTLGAKILVPGVCSVDALLSIAAIERINHTR
jgi:hypothetical protein